jgi:hypothetical protein
VNPYGPVTYPPGQPLLPAGWTCSAYYWAVHRDLPARLDYLQELGLRAARLASWHGLQRVTVPEGPWPAVNLWPSEIWAEAEARLAADFAAAQAEYWHCPEPQGQAAWDTVYRNGAGYTWEDFLEALAGQRRPPPSPPASALLNAHQYAAGARLLCGNGDAEFLTELVRHAADLAARYGVPAAWDSGYYAVWPAWVWSATADAMAQAAAGHGDYDPGWGSRQGPWRDPPAADDDVPWDGDGIRTGPYG